MIGLKARQVLLFLELLEASLQCERRKYTDVFDALERQYVIIPDVKSVRRGVIEELDKLNARLGYFMNVQNIRQYARDRREDVTEEMRCIYEIADQ